jgi:lipoate-protein ligase A
VLHELAWPEPLVPTVWVMEVEAPALVLGSTQRVDDVRRDRLDVPGLEITRRRSGGGAVFVAPGAQTWVDVLIPRNDPRWDDDVTRSFHWLGAAWRDALVELGHDATVHTGALTCGAFGRQVCFAALGSGEVTIDGAKAVGLSQRRTRAGARVQCTCYRHWDPRPMAALGVDPDALPPVAEIDLDPSVVVAALLSRLD